ncbi:hypothetical protein Btru_043782 [Bulinus truncatus]|nr:hypothetical protein Btru_043782 [Bulinus truncatus]
MMAMLKVLLVWMSTATVMCTPQNASNNCPTLKLDLVVIVDTSTSVGESNFILSLDFVRNILRPLPIGPDSVRVTLLRYSSDVEVVSYMNDHMSKDEKIQAVSYIKYTKGFTYTDKVLSETRTKVLVPDKGDRPDARDLVILITDGKSTRRRPTLREATLIKHRKYLQLFTIGVTKEIDEVELKTISSRTDMFLNIETFTDLNNYLGIITPVVCSGGVYPENENEPFLETTVIATSVSVGQTIRPQAQTAIPADQGTRPTDHVTRSNDETTQVKVDAEKVSKGQSSRPGDKTTQSTDLWTQSSDQGTLSTDQGTKPADDGTRSIDQGATDQVTRSTDQVTQSDDQGTTEGDNVDEQRDSEDVPPQIWKGPLLSSLAPDSKFQYTGHTLGNVNVFFQSSSTPGHSASLPQSTSISSGIKPLLSNATLVKGRLNVSTSVSESTLNLTVASARPKPLDPGYGRLLHLLSHGHCHNVSHSQFHDRQHLSVDPLVLINGAEGMTLNINIFNYNIDPGKHNEDV